MNERVLNTEQSRYFELVKSGSKLNEAVMYASSEGVHPLTIWVVADMSQPTHRDLLVNALDHSVSILLYVSYDKEKYYIVLLPRDDNFFIYFITHFCHYQIKITYTYTTLRLRYAVKLVHL